MEPPRGRRRRFIDELQLPTDLAVHEVQLLKLIFETLFHILFRRPLDSLPFPGPFVVCTPGVPDVGLHGLLLVFGLGWRAFAAVVLVERDNRKEAGSCEGYCTVRGVSVLLYVAAVNYILKCLLYAALMYYLSRGYTSSTVFMLCLDSRRGGLELVCWRRPRSSVAR